MNSQSLNGLSTIDANQITTDTIEVNESYKNKNITMEYDIINNSLETFNITTTPTPYTLNTDNLQYYYTLYSIWYSNFRQIPQRLLRRGQS